MELTRRDAIAALGAVGVSSATAGCNGLLDDGDPDASAENDTSPAGDGDAGSATADAVDADALGAVAEVLYPSDVTVTEEFVDTYVHGRALVDDAYLEEVAAAYEYVDRAATDRHDVSFASLPPEDRDGVLRELGLDSADAAPDADDGAEHARFYLIDELLFALYSTPKGTERAGIQNPKGHPGGTEAYQEAPE